MSKVKKSGGKPAMGSATSSAMQPDITQASGPDLLRVSGDLFAEIAADLRTAIEVVGEAVQAPEPAALLIALRALLEQVGAVADRAGAACTGHACVQDQDSWLLSPRGAEGIGRLETMRRHKLADRHAAAAQVAA